MHRDSIQFIVITLREDTLWRNNETSDQYFGRRHWSRAEGKFYKNSAIVPLRKYNLHFISFVLEKLDITVKRKNENSIRICF